VQLYYRYTSHKFDIHLLSCSSLTIVRLPGPAHPTYTRYRKIDLKTIEFCH
jgi:hypothetical protein